MLLAALVAAAAQVFWLTARVHLRGELLGSARELPWISPLAYLAWFLPPALVLLLLATRITALRSPRLQGAVVGALASFALLLQVPGLHALAIVALALGVGVQLGRMLGQDVARGMRRARVATLVLAGALFVAGIPGIVFYRVHQRIQLRGLAVAADDAPNIVLLILDTVRAANLSVYGYARPTSPSLERLAAEGVLFESAMAPAPWTAPSHATMLTGRYPFHLGISYRTPMVDSVRTVAEVLQAKGYATAAFMGNAYYAGRRTGFDRGFARYDDYPFSLWQLFWSSSLSQLEISRRIVQTVRAGVTRGRLAALLHAEFRIVGENQGDRYTAEELVENFTEWRSGIGRRPFFAMLNFFDAHSPYESPLQTRFAGGRTSLDAYDGAIAYSDSMIGRLRAHLQQSGELDNTIFVVVADHGEQFGEHDLNGHGNSLYLELLHVPLLIRAPGRVPGGVRVPEVVSLRDVPATLLDLAGIPGSGIPGYSLAPLWRDSAAALVSPALAEAEHPANQRNAWPTSYGPMKSVVTAGYHYIRRGDGQERVFRWGEDTTGRGDVTPTEHGRAVIDSSRAVLERLLGPNWTQLGPR
ncbi:MAG: sulfatase [Gemmatimonadaceae bacterium]